MAEETITAIEKFTHTLGQCLHDIHHEDQGQRVVHYWDDDSVYLPIRGVLSIQDDESQDAVDRVAQSLYSAGFLGTVHLLNAHSAELLGAIARWRTERTSGRAASLVTQFLNRSVVQQVIQITGSTAELQDLGEASDDSRRHRTKRIVEGLIALNSEAFTLIEASWGEWQLRLQRLLDTRKLIVADDVGDMLGYSRDDRFQLFAADISGRRQSRKALATALDAAALTELAHLCEASRDSGPNGAEMPRFFTSSRTLQNLYRDRPEWQEAFKFSYEERGEWRSGSAWRSGDYYYMRSSYGALRIGGRQRDLTGVPDLNDLRLLHANLVEALCAGHRETLRLVDEYSLPGDKKLLELIRRFSSHQMAEVWLQYGAREEFPKKLADLEALRRLGNEALTRQVASELEGQSLKRLEKTIQDRELSLRIIDAVFQASTVYAHARDGRPMSLNDDLGSVRWGLMYAGEDDRVSLQPTHRTPKSYADTIALYSIPTLTAHPESAERAIATLVGIDRFDLADKVMDRLDALHGEAMFILRMVVTIMRPGYQDDSALERQFRLLRTRYEQLIPEEKRLYCLGYAYAAFAIWSNMAKGGAWRGSSQTATEVARWCVDIVDEQDRVAADAVEPRRDIWYAHLVNHLVFVATIFDQVTPKVETYATLLERIAVKLDNYRFLDTVGVFWTWKAKQYSGHSQRVHDQRIALLERSVALLERASELARADTDVRSHLATAREMLIVTEGHAISQESPPATLT